MDPFTTNYLYEIITKCAQNELHQISLQQVKTAYASIGLKPGSKRKEELIQDIIAYLASILIKQCNGNQIREGFPLFNHNNDLFQRNPHVKNLIEACNQQIHITNIQLAQLNYSRINQAKRTITPTTNVYKCYCDQTIDPNYLTEHVIKCINPKCGKLLHRFCMKLKTERETYPLFECPDCVLMKCDPLHQVCKILVPPYVVDNRRKDFIIDENLYRDIKMNDTLAIEVRAIKLEDKSHEQCWPHNGELVLNQFKYLEFKPLQQNSSLKKRKDEKFVTTEVNPGSNSLLIKFVRGSDPRNPRAEETYIAAVYLVKRLTCDELVKKIKAENRRPIDECRKKIADDFETSSLDIDKLVYPMTCVFDMQPLKTPAKGTHCKHPNCFSLENFVNVWQKNNQRKWNCPICKLKSYDIVVDTFFEKIMDDLKKSGFGNPSQVEVEIMRNAEYRFVKNEDESGSEDEQRVEQKPEKQQPEKSMNLIVLDDSDEEGSNRRTAAEKQADKMNVEEPTTDHKKRVNEGENGEREVNQDLPAPGHQKVGANSVEHKDGGKGMVIENTDKKTKYSPIQISSSDNTPAKLKDPGDIDKMLKPGQMPIEKDQMKAMEQKQNLQNKAQPVKPGQPLTDFIQQQQQFAGYPQRPQQQQAQPQKQPTHPYLPSQQPMDFQQKQHLQGLQRPLPQDKGPIPPKQLPKQNEPPNLLNLTPNMQQNATFAKMLGTIRSNPNLTPQALSAFLPMLNMTAKSKPPGPGGRTGLDDINMFLDWQNKFAGGADLNAFLMRTLNEPYNNLRMNPSSLLPQADMAMNFLGGVNKNQGNIHNPPNTNILNQGSFLKDNLTPKHPSVRNEVDSNISASPKTPGTQKPLMAEKERSSKEFSEGAEKNIEKLTELSEYRIDGLPTFETFKTKKNLEPKKTKETEYQKNKKLVGFIMKQMPLQSKGMGTKHVKLNDTPGVGSDNATNGGMELDNTKPQEIAGKIQGKESDPICLD